MQAFKNILFDLGGIFLNIDYQKTEQAFIDLGVKDFGQLFSQQFSNTLFEYLETGKITPDDFYEPSGTPPSGGTSKKPADEKVPQKIEPVTPEEEQNPFG